MVMSSPARETWAFRGNGAMIEITEDGGVR